jgi:hypothetical protein
MNKPHHSNGFSAIPKLTQEIIPPTPHPDIFKMGANFAGSLGDWALRGFAVANAEQLESRKEICKGCEFWNPNGFGGTGSCKKCGCSTQAKLRMATSKCPIDKW